MNFIKNLFKSTPTDVSLPAIELEEWLDEYFKENYSNIQKKTIKLIENIKETKDKLSDQLDDLDLATLKHEITPREKHVLHGNRTAYINKVKKFLDELELPKPKFNYLPGFCEAIIEKMNKLAQGTQKAYYVLSQYYDVSEVGASLKQIEKNVISINDLAKSKEIIEIEELYSLARELNENIIRKEKIRVDIEELKSQLDKADQRKALILSRMDKLKGSKDYSMFKKLKKQEKDIDSQEKAMQKDMLSMLSNLEKPLKKSHHKTLKEDLVSAYLDNPVSALYNDDELVIVEALGKTDISILPDKRQDKAKDLIQKMDKEFFLTLRTKIQDLKSKKSDIRSQLEKFNVTMDFKELEYQLEHAESKRDRINSEIDKLEKELKSQEIKKLISRLQGQFLKYLEIELIIE